MRKQILLQLLLSSVIMVTYLFTYPFFASTTYITTYFNAGTLPISEQITVTVTRSFWSLMPQHTLFFFILIALNILVIALTKNRENRAVEVINVGKTN